MFDQWKIRWREWRRGRRYGPARRVHLHDGMWRLGEVNAVRIMPHPLPPVDEIAARLDQIYAWIGRPENGCRGEYYITFGWVMLFEDPHTAFLMKMRWG